MSSDTEYDSAGYPHKVKQQPQPPEQPSPASAPSTKDAVRDVRLWRQRNGVCGWTDLQVAAHASYQLQQAQQRIAELEKDLAKLFAAVGPMDEFDTVEDVIERIAGLKARLQQLGGGVAGMCR